MEKGEYRADRFETLTACPACTGSDLTSFKKSTFDYRKIAEDQIKITDSEYGKTWELSRCLDCGYVFANPAPSPAFIQELYSLVEDPLYEEEAPGRSKNFEKILSRLEKIHPEKGVLLDVGAATGILLHLAENRGWTADGIEPSSWAVRYAQKKYGLIIKEGSLEKATLPADFYAVVTLVDFIEHTARPFDALNKAAGVLKPGGTLCLVTPDIQSLAARLAGGKWWHFRPGHLGYFSKKSLSRLLERTGLRIVKKKKYAWTFSTHYLLSRKKWLRFLIKNPRMALFWKKIPIKLALSDSMEVYARKEQG